MAEHPVALFAKINFTLPCFLPVTTPAFVTVAISGLVLTQVPPEVGERVVVFPKQIVVLPVMTTIGFGLTVTDIF